jgi:Tfp pilus assembly protein PilN
MINLLPFESKKELAKEYKFRLANLTLKLLLFGVIIVTFSFVPALFSAFSGYTSLQSREAKLHTASVSREEQATLDSFDKFKNQIGVLKATSTRAFFVADVISFINEKKQADIQLTTFSFLGEDPANTTLVISGFAKTRESLAAFGDALKANKLFLSVELPVSNYSKKTNIDFTITIHFAKP